MIIIKGNENYNAIFLPAELIGEIREKISQMDLPISVEARSFDVKDPHVTLQYRPEVSLESYFGTECTITIKGYGVGTPDDCTKTGKCEGLLVSVSTESSHLNALYGELENDKNCSSERESEFHTHITMSFDKGDITPVETGYIDFIEFEPEDYIKVEGAVFGGFYFDGVDTGDKDINDARIATTEETSEDNEINPDDTDRIDDDDGYDGGGDR